jgi:hypothetical protein
MDSRSPVDSNHRALHELRLVIPGPHRARHGYELHKRIYEYAWPCGCSASGHDLMALEVRFCLSHQDVLTGYDHDAHCSR